MTVDLAGLKKNVCLSHQLSQPKLYTIFRTQKSKTKLQIQLDRTYEENITDIPTSCDTGNKKDSKGYKKSWVGYKLHVDCIDGDIPVSALLS